jgi:hypothetical protein
MEKFRFAVGLLSKFPAAWNSPLHVPLNPSSTSESVLIFFSRMRRFFLDIDGV